MGAVKIASEQSQEDQYLNLTVCAELMRRTENGVRGLVRRKAIPYRKPGGRLLFVRAEIISWINDSEGVRLQEVKNQ